MSVAPERLEQWLSGFAERSGGAATQLSGTEVVLTGADGAVAVLPVPFPPLLTSPVPGPLPTDPLPPGPPELPSVVELRPLVGHCLRYRRVGVLLVRLGGHAAGIFDGPRLLDSKVGTRPVHGRSAAGGQSQKRFARRREGQARVALAASADTAARILVPAAAQLDAVVLGGDRSALSTVLADERLAVLRPLVSGDVLDVPDPRLRVLTATPAMFRAVPILLREPPVPGAG
ncbi:MAG: hypothetical protein M3P91_03690 [Actinomycetota bacterium]|nr:hypothetical protein [Actinomycetota bacterium]